jgi:putative transposase
MKRSKFSEAQIAFVLKQAEEGTAIGEVCRKAGISEATFYAWRKKYAGLMPSEMRRLRQLEEENGKLKKLVADLSLDKAMLQILRHLVRVRMSRSSLCAVLILDRWDSIAQDREQRAMFQRIELAHDVLEVCPVALRDKLPPVAHAVTTGTTCPLRPVTWHAQLSRRPRL